MDNSLKKVSRLVKMILEADEKARNSDNYLYYKVVSAYSRHLGINMNNVSVYEFLLMCNEWGIPGFETVRRTRQKVQASFPELRAKDDVENNRLLRELQFRDYARGSVI